MIETTLLTNEIIQKSKLFKSYDGMLNVNQIPATDVAVATGINYANLYDPYDPKHSVKLRRGPFHIERKMTLDEEIEDESKTRHRGVYPLFRFSEIDEITTSLVCGNLEDYKNGIKIGKVYIPTYVTEKEKQKELFNQFNRGELKKIDPKKASFPTDEQDELFFNYRQKDNNYYVDDEGNIYLLLILKPFLDKYNYEKKVPLNKGVYHAEDTIFVKVKETDLWIDPEMKIAVFDVIPVAGIRKKNMGQYLPLFTQSLIDLKKVVENEKQIVQIKREISDLRKERRQLDNYINFLQPWTDSKIKSKSFLGFAQECNTDIEDAKKKIADIDELVKERETKKGGEIR